MMTKLLIGLVLFVSFVSNSFSQNGIVLTNSDVRLAAKARLILSNWQQSFINQSKASNYLFVTNWGEVNCDCKLSIGLDTNVVRAGSVANFNYWIDNSSTNHIKLAQFKWSLNLTNASGKIYPVQQPHMSPAFDGPISFRPDADPAEFITGKLSVEFGQDIEPGEYVIEPFTRAITTADGKTCILTSNPLEIEVISGK